MLNKLFKPYKIRNINFQYVADDNVIKFSFDFEKNDNNCEADFTFTFHKRDKAFKTLEAIIKKYISNNFEYLTKTHSNF
jgi:hypothetical protein